MSKIDLVRAEMVKAMKDKNKQRKDALSMLLQALKNKFIDKRQDLTEDEENAVILKEIKQAKESLEAAPKDRTDIIEENEYKIKVFLEFAPKQMSEEEIKDVIKNVLKELNLENPTAKEKGIIMKNLMPKIQNKAGGATVNKVLMEFLK